MFGGSMWPVGIALLLAVTSIAPPCQGGDCTLMNTPEVSLYLCANKHGHVLLEEACP